MLQRAQFPGPSQASFVIDRPVEPPLDDPQEMFRQAESRDNQDEYLEWAVMRQGGKITKVMFTCEGPEYWSHIAGDKTLLTKLYSDIVGQQVPQSELLTAGGTYAPRNSFNMNHAIHLIQPNNTLRAEINIASQATIIRRHGGHDPVTNPNELINCSGFGDADRHSDPHIGEVVNDVARQGCSLTLQDPIGLYIDGLPHPTNDLGIKGVGETGTIAAPPAILNAVVDAVSYLGVTEIVRPATPEHVWRAIQDAKAKGTGGSA
jgi:hypothetical protein